MKKLLLLIISALVLVSALGFSALASSDYEAELLAELSIMQGDPDGNMRYGDRVSRAECAKIVVSASKYRDAVDSVGKHSVFKDVTSEHWAVSYVSAGVKNGLFKGYLDSTFRPSNTVTYEEAITMFLHILGYSDEEIGSNWPYDQIDAGKKAGMLDGVNCSIGQELTRRDISKLIYNTLNACEKGSQTRYIENFNRTVGPVTVTSSDWVEKLGADSSAKIVRDGTVASVYDVKPNDVAYYMVEYNKVLVYSKKVTGIYENATPNKDNPVSVTVSGVTYNIEGDDAYSKLSSSGDFNYGDTVTLLLGKSGDVAGVADEITDETKVTGFLSAVGTKESASSGTVLTKPYIRLVIPSGEVREYITEKNYESYLNRVVTVKLSGGLATVTSTMSGNSVSGVFEWSSEAHKLGTHKLAENLEIIEASTTASGENAVVSVVYPQRLNGLELFQKDVLYASKNAEGYIDALVLNDVTGDAHSYGIVTSAKVQSDDRMMSATYEYIVNGTKNTLSTQGKTFGVSSGQAVKIKGDGRSVSSMTPLALVQSEKITSVNGSEITLDGSSYTMSDKVQIYVKNSYSTVFSLVSAEELKAMAPDYRALVYADDTDSAGGRVRIIVLLAD